MSIIGLTSSDNATDLDYRRIIGQIGPAGKLAAHENEVSFSTSDNEPWEIVVTIKLSNREEISTRKFFVCQGKFALRLFKRMILCSTKIKTFLISERSTLRRMGGVRKKMYRM